MPTPEEIQKAREEFAAAAATPVKAASFEPTAVPQASPEDIQKARAEFSAALNPPPAPIAAPVTPPPAAAPPQPESVADEIPTFGDQPPLPKGKDWLREVPPGTEESMGMKSLEPPVAKAPPVAAEPPQDLGGQVIPEFGEQPPAPPSVEAGESEQGILGHVKEVISKDFSAVWNGSNRGGVTGAIDMVTGALGKILGGAAEAGAQAQVPDVDREVGVNAMQDPQARAQAQMTATELLRGAVRPFTGWTYKGPTPPPETTWKFNNPIASTLLPTDLQQVGDLAVTLNAMSKFIEGGGWAVDKLFPMVGKNPANLMESISTLGAMAKRIGATGLGFFALGSVHQAGEMIAAGAPNTPDNLMQIPGQGAKDALLMMATQGLGELIVPYIAKMFDWVGQKTNSALFAKQEGLMRDALTKAYWEDQVAEAGGMGRGAPTDAQLHQWYKGKTPEEQAAIAINSDVWAAYKKAFPEWNTQAQEQAKPGAHFMEPPGEEPPPPPAGRAPGTPPPPEESVNLKPSPMGTGSDEVTEVGKVKAPAPEETPPEGGTPTPEAAPKVEAKPTPIENAGTGDAVIQSDQAAADKIAAQPELPTVVSTKKGGDAFTGVVHRVTLSDGSTATIYKGSGAGAGVDGWYIDTDPYDLPKNLQTGAQGYLADTKKDALEALPEAMAKWAKFLRPEVTPEPQAAQPSQATPAITPAPGEIAPETMAQSSAPANVEPVTPGRNTFTETPVQTRENKITEHEEITGQTKINAVTFKRFQDFVEAKDWPKVQEELHLSSANFTQAAFDHHFNPLQLMGRLEEGGMPHAEAKALIKEYEKQAYAPMRTEMGVRGGSFRQSPVVGMQDLLKTEPSEGGPQVQSSVKAAKGDRVPPQRDEFLAAIKDTPGAEITPEGLKLKLARRQKPEQAGKESVRTGVFYLPEGASTLRHYGGKSTGLPSWYGGPQRISAEATFKNPIVEKGGTGGMVPERVYDALMGKGAMQQLSDDIGAAMKEFEWKPRLDAWQKKKLAKLHEQINMISMEQALKPDKQRDYSEMNRLGKEARMITDNAPRDTSLRSIKGLLRKYGGDPKAALWIVEHSKAGNQLRYALQEHIIAHAVRAAGHDGVIGYNRSKGTFKMTEIFDVRQGQYPTNTGQVFSQFPQFYKKHPVEKPAFTVKGVTTHLATTPAGKQVEVPMRDAPEPGSPWAAAVKESGPKVQSSLKKVDREVGIRKGVRDVVTFEISVPMSKIALAPEQMPPVPMLTPQDARAYNADPARVKDFLKMYDRAIRITEVNSTTVKIGTSGKTEGVPVVRLSIGCQRSAVSLERVNLGIYPQDTKVEWCYQEVPAPGQDPKEIGGGCFANELFIAAFKSFENINVKPLQLATPEQIEQWFEQKPKKGSDNPLLSRLKGKLFVRMGDVGCDSHTIASGAAEAWLHMMHKHQILTPKGEPMKTIMVSAGYAPVTDAQYKALAKYHEWLELHISTSGWFTKPELMIRFGEFWAADQAGVPVSMRIITNADNLGGFRTPNHQWFLDLARKYGVQPWRFLETPYHNDKVPSGRRGLPDSGWRSKATGEFPYVCCEDDAKCLTCGVKCMTQADPTGSVTTTWQVKNPTYSPILEKDGDKVVDRPGPKVQMSVKAARELAPIYYSQMAKFLNDKLPGKGTGEDLATLIEGWAGLKEVGRNKNDVPIFSKAEFKADELKWSGLLPWLREQKGVITKAEVAKFLKDNPTEVTTGIRGKSFAIKQARKIWEDAFDELARERGVLNGKLAAKGLSNPEITTIREGVTFDPTTTEPGYRDKMIALGKSYLPDYNFQALADLSDQVRAVEVPSGGDTKYSQWAMEGPSEDYHETLSLLPGLKSADYYKWQGMIAEMQAKYGDSFWTMMTKTERAQLEHLHNMAGHGAGAVFKGAHWTEPNVVVHTRGANRVDADGKKAYVLEENQGDWHQQGRKKGYAAPPEEIKALRVEAGKISKEIESTVDQMTATKQERRDLGEVAEGKAEPKTPVTHKWVKKEVNISYHHDGGDFLSIPAQVLGNFAIHRLVTNSMKPGRYWRVTHVGTGLIASGPGVDFSSINATQAQARKFAEYLVEHGKANWGFKEVKQFTGENQALGKTDLQMAGIASGMVHPNSLGISTEPAPVRPGWSEEHKAKAAELDKRLETLREKVRELGESNSANANQLHIAEKGVANAPFSKTWPELGMKRALREAAEDPSIERLEWTAGAVQFERWGSERIDWKKEEGGKALTSIQTDELKHLRNIKTHGPLTDKEAIHLSHLEQLASGAAQWTVAAKEQHGGFAGGMDIEQTARDRGKLLEERGKKISTKEELDQIVKRTLSRERNNEEMSKLTDRLWERMQTEPEGTSLPRKEGMEGFYDKMLPTFMGKYVKQWGSKVGQTTVAGSTAPKWEVAVIDTGGLSQIRGPRGVVTNHDLREAGVDAPHNFSVATFRDRGMATIMGERLFGKQEAVGKTYPVWYVDITPEMRESVLYEGQAQFRLKEPRNVQATDRPTDILPHQQNRPPQNPHLPQDGEGSQRELEAFQSLYKGVAGQGTASWPTLRYDEELAVTPEFQRFVTSAHADGIDLIIPVRGGTFNAQLITDGGKTTILIDSGHDPEHNAEQFGGHEVGHHLLNNGDPQMVALARRVDTNSLEFKLYREWHNLASDAVGDPHLSEGEVVAEMACDYRGGIHEVVIDGSRVNFTSAFRPEGQARGGVLRALFGRPAMAAASPRAPPTTQESLRRSPKKPPKAPEDVLLEKYKLSKVALVGGKNWAKEQARRLEVKHMDMIREAVGEKKVGPKTIEMSKVLTNFIDHFREPQHLAQFYADQPPEVQGWLDKFAEVSGDPDLMTIVDKLKGAGEALATEAYDEEVIREAFENHQNRIYKEEGHPGHMAGAKYATATGHAKKRFYMTRLEARAPIEKGGGGKTFKVEGVAENLRILTEEIKNVIENRRNTARGLDAGWLSTDQHEGWRPAPWPQMYKRTFQFKVDADSIIREIKNVATEIKNSTTSSTTTTGGAAPGPAATGGSTSGPVQKMIDVITNSLEVRGVTPEEAKTYVRRVQEAAIRAAQGSPATPPPEGTPPPETITTIIKEVRDTLTTLETKQMVVGHKFGEVRRANMYMDTDGNVFAKVPVFAPPEVSKDLHNLFSTQDISPALEKVQQYNAVAKAGTLALSPFHLFAYSRNLLAIPGFLKMIHPVGYYKKGKALGLAGHIDTEGLIRAGLVTFSGTPPDWSELAEDRRTGLGELMGRNALTRKTRDAFWNLIAYNSSFIFEKVGNAYKLQFAHDVLAHLRNKYPNLTPEQAYYYAADHANDVFGGRNEEISGKLFGDRLASSAKARVYSRLLILARDWTMSNLKLFKRAFERGPSGHLARQYWGYAFAKIFSAVIAANLLVSLIDDRSAWQSFKDAFHDPKQLRWLDINITPFYKLAAKVAGYTPTEARKYLRVGGHFYDAFKMIINPLQFFHHKQSVLARFFWEGLTGQDWRGNVFTTLNEMLGVTDSVAGPLTGQLTKEGKSTGAIGYTQMPSFMLHQVRGIIPIPGQNLLYALMGEMDGFTAAIKAGGGMASSANVKTNAQDLMTEYYQNVTPTVKSPEQKERTALKKELLKVYRDGDLDTFKERLEEAITDKKISHQEAQQWADEAPLPPGVQSFVKLPIDMAMKVMATANEDEKKLWMPFFLRKIGQMKPDTIMAHQEGLVKLLRKEGADDTADIIDSIDEPKAAKALHFVEPDVAQMHRLDMLEGWGVVDTYVASLLRQQALSLAKPQKRPSVGANPMSQGITKQRSMLDKMLGLRS